MIKITKAKSPKRTSLKKQLEKNIMLLIMGLFLILAIISYLATNFIIKTIAVSSGPSLSTVVSYVLEEKDLDSLNTEKQSSEIYIKMNEIVSNLADKGKNLVDDAYIIMNNSNNKWTYVVSKSKTNSYSLGQAYSDTSNMTRINTAISTGLTQLDKTPTSISVLIPIKTKQNVNMIMGLNINKNFIIQANIAIFGVILIIMLIGLFITRILVGRIAKRQTHSITSLVEKMKEMADLKGDLTKRIKVESNDEIGDLAECTNKMLDTIQEMLIQFNEISIKLNSTTEEFSSSFISSTDQFKYMDTLTKDIGEKIEKQTSELSFASKRIRQINDAIVQVAENSQVVTEHAISTSENASDGNRVVDELGRHSQEISKVVNETSNLVIGLGNKSEQINGIADTIGAIADQTNLLALNASIEAARAGEQGKGFVVVAEEVKELAEESSKSAKEIFELIQEVRKGIADAAASMKQVSEKTLEESDFVKQVEAKFNDISKSINNVSQKVEEVSSSTEEMSANTSVITNQIENLAKISEEHNAATEQIASGIDGQVKSVLSLTDMTKDLSKISEELVAKLSGLKLE